MAIAGDAAATDPVCARSPRHVAMNTMAAAAEGQNVAEFVYRRI